MTHDPESQSLIVLRIPREEKGRYVAASRAAGLTLAAWMRATLTAAAPPVSRGEEEPATQPGETPGDSGRCA
jgi:hypothetical protein